MTETPPPRDPADSEGHDLCGTLDAEQLGAFIDGRMSAEAAAAVEAHLTHCEVCRWVVAGSVREPPVRRRRR